MLDATVLIASRSTPRGRKTVTLEGAWKRVKACTHAFDEGKETASIAFSARSGSTYSWTEGEARLHGMCTVQEAQRQPQARLKGDGAGQLVRGLDGLQRQHQAAHVRNRGLRVHVASVSVPRSDQRGGCQHRRGR